MVRLMESVERARDAGEGKVGAWPPAYQHADRQAVCVVADWLSDDGAAERRPWPDEARIVTTGSDGLFGQANAIGAVKRGARKRPGAAVSSLW